VPYFLYYILSLSYIITNTRWEDGDWTDDTDQMILILEELIASSQGRQPPDFRRYGESILKWAYNGFTELGDVAGSGLGAHTKKVLEDEAFLTNPFNASEQVWLQSQKQSAANGTFEYSLDEFVLLLTRTGLIGNKQVQ